MKVLNCLMLSLLQATGIAAISTGLVGATVIITAETTSETMLGIGMIIVAAFFYALVLLNLKRFKAAKWYEYASWAIVLLSAVLAGVYYLGLDM